MDWKAQHTLRTPTSISIWVLIYFWHISLITQDACTRESRSEDIFNSKWVILLLCYLPFPSLGGASFALKPSTSAFESVSNTTPTCISDLNLVYLLLSRGYHLGAYMIKNKKYFKNIKII